VSTNRNLIRKARTWYGCRLHRRWQIRCWTWPKSRRKIDLGSGDGRIVITAAKRGARALGIEYNPDMVALSKRNAAKEGVNDKVQFIRGDLFESDFSEATVITMFLLTEINLKLRPKILDLKPGTRIVSNSFDMAEWKADQTVAVKPEEGCDNNFCEAYLWIVPAKVEGTWKLPQGELMLRQQFQMISGKLQSGANATPITNGKLNGDQISFTVGDEQYTGRVSGNTMQGTFKTGGKTTNWSATRTADTALMDLEDHVSAAFFGNLCPRIPPGICFYQTLLLINGNHHFDFKTPIAYLKGNNKQSWLRENSSEVKINVL
jgi:hypothetical protein